MFSTGLRSGLFPGHSNTVVLFSFINSVSAILHEDRAAVDVHVQFQLLFEQFHVLVCIHSGVSRDEMQTSSAMA